MPGAGSAAEALRELEAARRSGHPMEVVLRITVADSLPQRAAAAADDPELNVLQYALPIAATLAAWLDVNVTRPTPVLGPPLPIGN